MVRTMHCTAYNCFNLPIIFEIGFHRKDGKPFVTTTHYCEKHKNWGLENVFKDKTRIIEFDKPPLSSKEILKKWRKSKQV